MVAEGKGRGVQDQLPPGGGVRLFKGLIYNVAKLSVVRHERYDSRRSQK